MVGNCQRVREDQVFGNEHQIIENQPEEDFRHSGKSLKRKAEAPAQGALSPADPARVVPKVRRGLAIS
jgi:hypothetical protein